MSNIRNQFAKSNKYGRSRGSGYGDGDGDDAHKGTKGLYQTIIQVLKTQTAIVLGLRIIYS